MASEVRINPRVNRLLRRLPDEIKDGLKDAYVEAAQVLQYEIMVRAPQDTGDMAASVGYRLGPKGRFVTVGPGLSGPSKARNWQRVKARWIEFGTKAHKIKAKNRKALTDEEQFFGKLIQSPGTPPKPFLKPALEASRPQIRDQLGEAVSKVVRTYAQRNS